MQITDYVDGKRIELQKSPDETSPGAFGPWALVAAGVAGALLVLAAVLFYDQQRENAWTAILWSLFASIALGWALPWPGVISLRLDRDAGVAEVEIGRYRWSARRLAIPLDAVRAIALIAEHAGERAPGSPLRLRIERRTGRPIEGWLYVAGVETRDAIFDLARRIAAAAGMAAGSIVRSDPHLGEFRFAADAADLDPRHPIDIAARGDPIDGAAALASAYALRRYPIDARLSSPIAPPWDPRVGGRIGFGIRVIECEPGRRLVFRRSGPKLAWVPWVPIGRLFTIDFMERWIEEGSGAKRMRRTSQDVQCVSMELERLYVRKSSYDSSRRSSGIYNYRAATSLVLRGGEAVLLARTAKRSDEAPAYDLGIAFAGMIAEGLGVPLTCPSYP